MIQGYSKDYAIEAGIPLSEYHFPAEPGECDATLTMKIWGKHKNLLCYFERTASPLRLVQHGR